MTLFCFTQEQFRNNIRPIASSPAKLFSGDHALDRQFQPLKLSLPERLPADLDNPLVRTDHEFHLLSR